MLKTLVRLSTRPYGAHKYVRPMSTAVTKGQGLDHNPATERKMTTLELQHMARKGWYYNYHLGTIQYG